MSIIAEIHRDLEKGALQLLVEYRERLLHEAVKLCGDASQAEDLVFRTIERVLQKSETYRSDDNLFGWMKTILTNLYRDDLKHPESRLARTVPLEQLEELAGLDFSAEERILRNSDGEAVREALGRIDPEHRRLLQMRFYEEMTLEEIAAYLKCPVGTVWRRMQLALKFLSGKLNAGVRAGRPMAILAALMLAGSLFGAVSLGVVAAMKGLGALGTEGALGSLESEGSLGAEGTLESLEAEGSLGSVADSIDPNPDPIVSNPDPIVPKDTIPAEQISTTENTNTAKEETMNLKTITKATAKLAVGAALTTGLAANAQAGDAYWTFDGNKTLTDGTGWKFGAERTSLTVNDVTKSGLRITGLISTGPETIIDFQNKSIKCGDEVIPLISIRIVNGGTSLKFIEEIYLPKTLLEIGTNAFNGNDVLRKVDPFLPKSVVIIGEKAFYNCKKLEGDLKVKKATVGANAFCMALIMGSMELGKGISSLGSASFSYCHGLTNITMLCESAMDLPRYTMQNLDGTKLREMKLGYMQSVRTDAWGWFTALSSDYQAKVRILKSAIANYSYTPWDEATHRALYEAKFPNDPETPLGVCTYPTGKQWLFTYVNPTGMKLIFQ